jgi:FkbM family methyltransferase
MYKLIHLGLRLPKILRRRDFLIIFIERIKNKLTIGNKGAEWTVCSDFISPNSLIYSFGVGTDISFDIEMIRKFDLCVHAFDPTPKSINWINEKTLSPKFNFHPYGVASFSGKIEFTLPNNSNFVSGSINDILNSDGEKIKIPVKDISKIMQDLSHKHIDILKMDIEGAEYDVIDFIIENNISIKQILVEFHHRFPKIGINKSKEAIKKLKKSGYKIFHISNNGEEYSFIKT